MSHLVPRHPSASASASLRLNINLSLLSALLFLLLASSLPASCLASEDDSKEDRGGDIGEYYGPRFGRNQPKEEVEEDEEEGGGMTGIGLIFLILALVAILGGIYFAAWCLCSVQRSRKEGHYILDSEERGEDPDQEMYGKKFYPGLDQVDEAKETYVKNPLELDTINESTPLPESATAASEKEAEAEKEAEDAGELPPKVAPSAPEDGGGQV